MVKVVFKWTYILMYKSKSKVKDTSVRYLYIFLFRCLWCYKCLFMFSERLFYIYLFTETGNSTCNFVRTLQVWDFFGVRVDLNWPLGEIEIPFWLSFKFKALIKEMFVFHFGPFNVYFSFYVIWCGEINKYVSIRFRIRVVGGIFSV